MAAPSTRPHPLTQLSIIEAHRARDIVIGLHSGSLVSFRTIFLEEPPKAELQKFLEIEHNGDLNASTVYPKRVARVMYDVIGGSKIPKYQESLVDVEEGVEISREIVDTKHHARLTLTEFDDLVKAAWASSLFKEAVSELHIPEGFEVVVEPWPYGGTIEDENPRYFQGLCFAQDKRNGNPDSNFYGYPLPLIPIMDAHTREIIRVERLATGGIEDGFKVGTHDMNILKHCKPSEYVPELVENGTRKGLKPINVVQPEGASFVVDQDESLVEWQKWRFRVGFNHREGATIHDVRYDGRSILYRLSMSEMTVPYADARAPFYRKQAFDFGDGGAGDCANNLELGCDCLGVIKYFDGTKTQADGTVSTSPNVICLHEQDAGIGWKHTNWRTGRAVVTRHRELVVQFIITLANYEYVFAYKFDLAGGITVETRATGIVSVVSIDAGKNKSEYGNVVAPGVLAQNHQHIFCVRIDPAVDGPLNTIMVEESHAVADKTRNPYGNFYEVVSKPVEKVSWIDAAPMNNMFIKMINPAKKNKISGKNVGYKFMPAATQVLLAQDESIQAQRARFAQHHVWVTKYRDGELFAGGRYTLQSKREIDGVADAVERGEQLPEEGEDVVVWNCFGLTHNPRVEDWPVMPVEIHELRIKPCDFFEGNPAIDVPGLRNLESRLVVGSGKERGKDGEGEGEKKESCCN
ncbi:92037083-fbfe-43d0-a3a1-22c901f4ee68 [Sclerotinia trifoliorum]|uniref:Amine oxidase n=1 Tax=Sclerotinia trifoliorum TaxID=28548 RepID=A0A8H2VP75_9HELO|nr:92037083-fbfe-43d0-a3a1-22c901f4ee68 [Sclerotinia trifoliorum]